MIGGAVEGAGDHSVEGHRARSVLLVSTDCSFRQRAQASLARLRWQVREASSGAQAWMEAEKREPRAMVLDAWLPDLQLSEFLRDFRSGFPGVEIITMDESDPGAPAVDGACRREILHALSTAEGGEETRHGAAARDTLPVSTGNHKAPFVVGGASRRTVAYSSERLGGNAAEAAEIPHGPALADRLPELIGKCPCMLEVARRVRLVAPRSTPVLLEGPTGSGKEVVARAIHRLSPRCREPFVAINCSAIPETLLEAEFFGHTRGAFTGAVQNRAGRIEAAEGGTLFLDEIGELPLAMQAKLLRFVESGEIQRIGQNDTTRVDVRIVAATHRSLQRLMQAGAFRADLYYRLAVFQMRTPALAAHWEDLPLLVEHFLGQMGRKEPMKHIDASAMEKLCAHPWPGNVRELEHVLERAAILCGERSVITADEIDFGEESDQE